MGHHGYGCGANERRRCNMARCHAVRCHKTWLWYHFLFLGFESWMGGFRRSIQQQQHSVSYSRWWRNVAIEHGWFLYGKHGVCNCIEWLDDGEPRCGGWLERGCDLSND